jgi:phosphotransferase system HPr (HPr) family protein
MKSSLKFAIKHPAGLHARPASLFVQTAQNFTSDIQVKNHTDQGEFVNAKSILSVLTLGVMQGHQIEIIAYGKDAEAAIAALKTLIENNFGDKQS